MKIGINLVACYDKGTVFDSSVLDVDAEEYFRQFRKAYTEAWNLAASAAYITSENASMVLTKTYRQALHVAESAGVTTSETLQKLFTKAAREVLSLQGKIPPLPEGAASEDAPEEKQVSLDEMPQKLEESKKDETGKGAGKVEINDEETRVKTEDTPADNVETLEEKRARRQKKDEEVARAVLDRAREALIAKNKKEEFRKKSNIPSSYDLLKKKSEGGKS